MEDLKFSTEKEFFEAIETYDEYKEEKLSGFDSEKGFVYVTVYLKRAYDGQKFTAEYTRGGQGNKWSNDLTFYAVKKKEKKEVKKTWSEIFSEVGQEESLVSYLEKMYEPPKLKK